mmetsp:Transcript_41351/g.125159  ORF Transcript_41351/g.125159 Transcript_41351/m.125159 type:complete len:211 (-) Transcript_41351:502-1134(-)
MHPRPLLLPPFRNLPLLPLGPLQLLQHLPGPRRQRAVQIVHGAFAPHHLGQPRPTPGEIDGEAVCAIEVTLAEPEAREGGAGRSSGAQEGHSLREGGSTGGRMAYPLRVGAIIVVVVVVVEPLTSACMACRADERSRQARGRRDGSGNAPRPARPVVVGLPNHVDRRTPRLVDRIPVAIDTPSSSAWHARDDAPDHPLLDLLGALGPVHQ